MSEKHREKRHYILGNEDEMISNFSSEAIQAKKKKKSQQQWNDVSEVLKEKNSHPRLL